jgi:5-methylcytosine-specific restriction endonuclease McrA
LTPATLRILKKRVYSANSSAVRNGQRKKLSIEQLVEQYERQAGSAKYPLCSYCGREMRGKMLSLDHVVPFAAGGQNEISNVELVCSRDNRYKRALPAETYAKLLKTLKDAGLLTDFFCTYQPRRGRRW